MGEPKGQWEILKTPLYKARLEMSIALPNNWPHAFPNFDDNYKHAQMLLSRGIFHRKQMPVIEVNDLEHLKEMLQDQVPSFHVMRNPRHLVPLQSQVYLSNILNAWKGQGLAQAGHHLHDNPIFVSADSHVIDGHHRWGGSLLQGRDVPAYEFGLGAAALLAMAVGLSDLERHTRNA